MSSSGGLAAAVEGGIEGGAVLPAAPDDPDPGAGQDPDGMRMPAAAAGCGGVDGGGPGGGHAAAVGEVHQGGGESDLAPGIALRAGQSWRGGGQAAIQGAGAHAAGAASGAQPACQPGR